MTLIGEVPPGLAATAARVGDAATVLDEDQVTGFVQEQLAAHPFDGRSVCVLVPDATRTCPLPLLLRAVHGALHGRVSRLTVLIALGTHAPMGEEALAAHLGYAPGRLADDLSRHHGRQPRVVEARDVRRPRHGAGLPHRRAVRGPDGPGGAGAAQPRGRRARRRAGARPGAAARGRRDLRRQQVLLPRRRRPEDHRRLALAGCADHVGGDHRHHRDHPGAGADRRRRGAHPVGEARVLCRDGRGRGRCGGRRRGRHGPLAGADQRAALGVVRRHPRVVGERGARCARRPT